MHQQKLYIKVFTLATLFNNPITCTEEQVEAWHQKILMIINVYDGVSITTFCISTICKTIHHSLLWKNLIFP